MDNLGRYEVEDQTDDGNDPGKGTLSYPVEGDTPVVPQRNEDGNDPTKGSGASYPLEGE